MRTTGMSKVAKSPPCSEWLSKCAEVSGCMGAVVVFLCYTARCRPGLRQRQGYPREADPGAQGRPRPEHRKPRGESLKYACPMPYFKKLRREIDFILYLYQGGQCTSNQRCKYSK